MLSELFLLVIWLQIVISSYRNIHLLSTEECHQPEGHVQLDPGASVVVSLETEPGSSFFKCDLEMRASDGYGLMVWVEEGDLGPRWGDKCGDYLQLGIDDNVPFFTIDKSDELCGDELNNFSYDVSNGKMWVWVRLDGRKGSKLRLIVTSYLGKDSQVLTNFRSCANGIHWVRKDYFCDGRTNCAMDTNPADESSSSCISQEEDGSDPRSSHPTPVAGPPLNLVTITLVLASTAVVLPSLLLLLSKLHKARRCCWARSSVSDSDCELPDISIQVMPLQARQPTGTELSVGQLQASVTTALVGQQRGTTPDTEPPPAYSDLFPPGYQFSTQKESTITNTEEEIKDDNPVAEEASSSQA